MLLVRCILMETQELRQVKVALLIHQIHEVLIEVLEVESNDVRVGVCLKDQVQLFLGIFIEL